MLNCYTVYKYRQKVGVSELYCSQVSLFIKIGSNGTIHSSVLTVSKYFFHFIQVCKFWEFDEHQGN